MLDWFEQLSINCACFPAGSPVSLGQIGALPNRKEKGKKIKEKEERGKRKEKRTKREKKKKKC